MPQQDFDGVFQELKAILQAFETKLAVDADSDSDYALNSKIPMKTPKAKAGQPLFFGSARLGKAYVSCHLFPLYMFPDLLEDLPPELKKRMQGKTCFNFRSIAEVPTKELARLTKRGFDRFKAEKLV